MAKRKFSSTGFRKTNTRSKRFRRRGHRRIPRNPPFVEQKYMDHTLAAQSVSSTATVNTLNAIAQGTDNTNRVGRKIRVKSLYVRGNIIAGDATNNVMIWIGWDTQTNGSQALATQIFQSQATDLGPLSPLNLNYGNRFITIKHKNFTVDTSGNASRTFKWYKKLNTVCTYGGTAADTASIYTNALVLVVVSDSIAVSHPSISFYCRIRFTDE